MGAGSSKEQEGEGIITVVPAATRPGSSRGASPLPHAIPSSRPSSRLSQHSDAPHDPLLQHLADLKAQGAKLDAALFAAAPAHVPRSGGSSTTSRRSMGAAAPLAAANSDPDSLLADLAVAQQVSSDTAALNNAIAALVTDYQAWHGEHMQALVQNQEYITRTMDTAEAKADTAMRHVQLQTIKLKQLTAGLAAASQLPVLLQQLTAATEALELQLHKVELQADAVLATAAASAAAAAARAGEASAGGAGAAAAAAAATGATRAGSAASNDAVFCNSSGSRTGSIRSWLGVGSGSRPP